MSSQPSMSTCCLTGTLATGTPTGSESEVAGLPTYIARPSNESVAKTIIFLPDGKGISIPKTPNPHTPSLHSSPAKKQTHQCPCKAFGYTLPNTRLLADKYAAAGFTAYIPDVHSADSLSPSLLTSVEPTLPARAKMSYLSKTLATLRAASTLGPWLLRHREAVARPVIEKFITDVRSLPGVEKVGIVGFCWGGRYAILAAQAPFSGNEGRGVDAAYAAHPSLCAIPGDFEDVCAPLSIALGERDSYLGASEVAKIEEVMDRKKRESGVEGEVVVYKDQVHGFALRGDQESDKDRKALEDAAMQGIEWFKRHLA